MTEVYKYLNGHSPYIMNNIFKLTEKMYNLRNIYNQTENARSLKYGLDAIRYHASKPWQEVPISKAASLALFKNCIKTWKCDDCP